MERKGLKKAIIVIFVGLFLVTGLSAGSATAKPVDVSIGCGPAVASGYAAGVALFGLLNKKMKGFRLVPIEMGSAAAIRRVFAGQLDGTYSNNYSLVGSHMYTGPFKKNRPKPGTQPYQAIWFWPSTQFVATRIDTNIYTLDDLIGKTISIGDPKEGLYAFAKASFKALGLTDKWTERIVGGADRAQALKSKQVDAILGAVNANNTLARHTVQLELYNKLRAVKMTKAQEDLINSVPGVTVGRIPAKLFKRDMGMELIPGPSVAYGWAFSPSANADMVYQFVKNIFENSAKLVELARPFEMFSKDPKGTVIAGLKGVGDKAPVHPGAAKYYKEIGIWDNAWVVGKSR